jgi:hypothetical protein
MFGLAHTNPQFAFRQAPPAALAHGGQGALYIAHHVLEHRDHPPPHHPPIKDPILLATPEELTHALAALGLGKDLTNPAVALVTEEPHLRSALCGVVRAALALNEDAWRVSQELHDKDMQEGAGQRSTAEVVEREWSAAKGAVLASLEEELMLFDATLEASHRELKSTHEKIRSAFASFCAFLDSKVHEREARRDAWERSERLKKEHAAAILPPHGMLAAVLRGAAPRHPSQSAILSSGGGPEEEGGGALGMPLLSISQMAAGGTSGLLSALSHPAEFGDKLIHVDHCASADLPKMLHELLSATVKAIAEGAAPGSPHADAIHKALPAQLM